MAYDSNNAWHNCPSPVISPEWMLGVIVAWIPGYDHSADPCWHGINGNGQRIALIVSDRDGDCFAFLHGQPVSLGNDAKISKVPAIRNRLELMAIGDHG